MRRVTCLTIILLLVLAVAANAQFAKVGTAGLQFLKIGVGARPLGMGQSYVALADDPSCLFWNPGGVSRLEGTQFIGAFTKWFADINISALGVTYTVPEIGSFGLSAILLNTGYMIERTAGSIEGTTYSFTSRDWAIGLTYARNLTDRFSIGGTVRIVREELVVGEPGYSDTGILMDLGILYDTGYRGIKLGVSIMNFGPDFVYEVDDDRDGLVNEDKNNDRDDDGDLLIDEDVEEDPVPAPLCFRAGISMPFVLPLVSETDKLNVSVEVYHPNDNVEQYNLGLEYLLMDMVAIRGGFRFNMDGNEDKDSYKHVGDPTYTPKGDFPLTGLTLGLGVKYTVTGLGTAMVDYAFENYGILGTIHRASFSVSF